MLPFALTLRNEGTVAGGPGLLLSGRLRRRQLRDRCNVALLGLTSAFSARAAADPLLASATSTLTDLGFTLADLDPDDGLTPSITFGPYSYSKLRVEMHGEERVYWRYVPGGLSDGEAGALAEPRGRGLAVRGDHSLSANASVFVSDVTQHDEEVYSDPFDFWEVWANLDGSPYNAFEFTLSPGTAVTFHGRSMVDVTMNLEPLVGHGLLAMGGFVRESGWTFAWRADCLTSWTRQGVTNGPDKTPSEIR